jgi:hypothetical protein
VGGDDKLAGWGVDWPSGEAVGSWYAANDITLVKLVHAYVSATHDVGFLATPLGGGAAGAATGAAGVAGGAAGAAGAAGGGPTVWQQLVTLATAWRQRVGPTGGLADFGGPPNLLECVPTYVHRVAAFNAAAVWSSRLVGRAMGHAALEEPRRERASRGAALVAEAAALAAAVLGLAVGDGSGVWYAEQPDGTRLVNRHVIDFAYVAEFLKDDLPRPLREAMVRLVAPTVPNPSPPAPQQP